MAEQRTETHPEPYEVRDPIGATPEEHTMTSEPIEEFDWRDGTVRWRRHGHGPPVIMCHGTPWSSQVWASVTRALATHWTVYRWDMIGYGRSDMRDGQDVSLAAQGELLAALLDHWELPHPAIVAHDVGGAVALRAHLRHVHAFSSLALVDVVALAPWGSAFFRLVHDHPAVFEQLPPALHAALVRAYIASASHRGLSGADLDHLAAPWLDAAGQLAFYRQIAQADQRHTDDIEPHYAGLDIPVHIVWGTEDAWIPVATAHRLHQLIPGATLRLIPDAGHLIQLDAPAELAVELDRWLTRSAA
jgi:pimeloyl-ACP methyl ester carboxylesterase